MLYFVKKTTTKHGEGLISHRIVGLRVGNTFSEINSGANWITKFASKCCGSTFTISLSNSKIFL